MNKVRCGLCDTKHGIFESCKILEAPGYAWAYEWLTDHKGKWEFCWVVPLATAPSSEDRWFLVHRYFRRIWGAKVVGGGDKVPHGGRKDYQVILSGNVGWTIIYRWCPQILKEAEGMKEFLLEDLR